MAVGTLLVSIWLLGVSRCSPCGSVSYLEWNDAPEMVVEAFLHTLPPFSCLVHLSLGSGSGFWIKYDQELGNGKNKLI